MDHNTESLEYYSASQQKKHENDADQTEYTPRPLKQRLLAWVAFGIVLVAFLGTCYWLAFYGR